MFGMQGRKSRAFWATREIGNQAYIDGYWETRTHLLRQAIVSAVVGLGAGSLLEIGCHCGVNLWAINQAAPQMKLAGIDVSRFTIENGRTLCSEFDPDLRVASSERIPFADKSFDAVLSSGTLLCVADARRSVGEIARVARRFIVLSEPYPENIGVERYSNTSYWIRDYTPELHRVGFSVKRLDRLTEAQSIGHMNSILIAAHS